MAYKPATPFTVAMKLLVPVDGSAYGVSTKAYTDPKDIPDNQVFFGSFRTFGGTENIKNDVYTVIDTAVIDTWYRPDIKSNSRIYICETAQTYDVIGTPEDIDQRHQYLKFKVQKVGGKV